MIKAASKTFGISESILHRTLPFVVFMAFIAIDEGIQFAAKIGSVAVSETALYYLYPVKTVAVGLLLYKFRSSYTELRLQDLSSGKTTVAVCLAGLATFFIWISLDTVLSVTGAPRGFNPNQLPDGPIRFLMTATRVAGAVVVVPLMEELFWRSFLLRYLVDADFESVSIGRFTWASFLVTTVLFGLEHHLFLAGMAAGAIYSIILYKTRSLVHCVLAHAVTNLALACHVLYTGKWFYW